MTDLNFSGNSPEIAQKVNIAAAKPMKVSLFKCLSSSASKAVDFDEEIERMVRYDGDVEDKTKAYRTVLHAVGKKEADEQIKGKVMPACSIAVLFNGVGKQVQHILGFTKLAFADLDHMDKVDEAFLKVKADPHTRMVYKTVGEQGLRVIYSYVREDADAHIDSTSWKAAFLKGNRHYAELTGQEFDNQCADYSHLCGLAHDENVYVNRHADPFIITDEEIVEANFAPGSEGGRPRKEHPTGSFEVTIEDATPKVKRMLEKKNIIFQAGHHHDYVMHASFLYNRFGVDLDEVLEYAESEWSDYNSKQCEATICSCYKKTEEHGTWKLRMPSKNNKVALITLPEITDWVKKSYELKYDEVTDLTYCKLKDANEWKTADTRAICTIRRKIAEDTGMRVLKNDVQDIIWSDIAPMVHPIRDYLNALPRWDGIDHVRQLASYVTIEPVLEGQSHEDAQHLFEEFFHKWMIANVGMWLKDSVVNHEMVILVGPQGIYKTTFFRRLLPPQLYKYYWENNHNSFKHKDDHIALGENMLAEVEEFNITKPDDVGIMKSLITANTIKERRPYARQREEKHRLAGFCGTCNEQHFLTDDTGNRRFLCFLVSNIIHPDEWEFDMDQLYAQLRDEFLSGVRYWLNRDEEQRMAIQNEAFQLVSDEEMLLFTHYRKPIGNEPFEWMNSASIAQQINGGRLGYGLSSKKISSVLTRRKFPFKHDRYGNFYGVVKITRKQAHAELAKDTDCHELITQQPQEADLPF